LLKAAGVGVVRVRDVLDVLSLDISRPRV
jgi:hypothetical protein